MQPIITMNDRLAVLEDILNDSIDTNYTQLNELYQQLADAQQEVIKIRNRLHRGISVLNGQLAVQVRNRQPSLEIKLNPESCVIGYYSRALEFTPSLRTGLWAVESPDAKLRKKFIATNPPLALSGSISELATSIAVFFARFYRSLGEELVGTGAIIIEGKNRSFGELANFAKSVI